MRRKSERNKSSPTKKPEKVARRTTRRNAKTPEKSIVEEESENSSEHASSSEAEAEEVVVTKRSRRNNRTEKLVTEEVTRTPRARRTRTTTKNSDVNDDDCVTVDVPNEDFSSKPDGEEASTANADAGIESSSKTDETADSNAEIDTKDNGESSTTIETPAIAETEQSNADDSDKASVNESTVDTTEDSQPKEEANEQVVEPNDSKTVDDDDDDDNDVAQPAQKSDREVIPDEETDQAVEDVSTAKSVSSVNNKNDLNDFSASDAAKQNKNNKISENIVNANADNEDDSRGTPDKENEDNAEAKNGDDRPDGKRQTASVIGSIREKDKVEKIRDRMKEKAKENSSSTPIVRKRRWLSSKSSDPKKPVIAISTDSLKGLISDVKPVPLSDVKLESSPEPEPIEEDVKPPSRNSGSGSSTSNDSHRRSDEGISTKASVEEPPNTLNATRKISIVTENDPRPPSPAKHSPCSILYITNLVRPFTVLQLRGLLMRTGKIVESGFWMDKIKSKCFVKYETEDEAVETRHALHGVRWPTSNPKCLNVDFGNEALMEKAIASTSLDAKPVISMRDDRNAGGWDGHDEKEKVIADRPVREWDVGKKAEPRRPRDSERDDKDRENRRSRDRENRRSAERERRKRSPMGRKQSTSLSPGRKFIKKEDEPPLRLLDDLFRKTKATPCIYWLPLTPEQIAIKEEARQKQMAEHQRRIEAIRKERAEREQERAKERAKRAAEREKSEDRDRRRERTDKSEDRDKRRDRYKDRNERSGRRRY